MKLSYMRWPPKKFMGDSGFNDDSAIRELQNLFGIPDFSEARQCKLPVEDDLEKVLPEIQSPELATLIKTYPGERILFFTENPELNDENLYEFSV